MKILFLNPHLYDSPLLGTLRGLGVATIVCSDLRDCELVFKLHATSISLFVGHDEDGVGMNEVVKKTARFARTPVILTTSKWTDQKCIEHQSGPMGANAYLRMPVDDKEFIHVVDQILGTELSHGKGFNLSDDLSAIGPIETDEPAPVRAAPIDLGGGLDIAGGGLDLIGGGAISLAGPSEDKTSFTPIDLAGTGGGPSIEAQPLTAAPTDGITLQTDLSAMGISPSRGLQIEDAADVYGQQGPVSSEPIDPDLVFNLEAPLREHYASAAASESTGNTKEFRIEGTMGGEPPTASEILATPTEATNIDNLAPLVSLGGEFGPLGDDQPTRVATPILSSSREALPSTRETASEEIDAESLAAMPYLGREGAGYSNPLAYREPMDDAVVPGGAATAPDTETLKKYLYLREQDVAALSAQLRQAREQIGLLEGQLKHERAVSSEFAHLAQEQDRRIDGFEREKTVALESAQKEFDDLKFEMKRRTDKIRVMELQVKEATETTERLKERVRNDIRKIRTREKELENRLEIMKKDSEALLSSREQKIIELKRKLDLMEFNTDLIQDLLEKERQTATGLREKLAKAAQMMRVAGGLLGPDEEAVLETGVAGGKSGVNDDERTTAA